MRIGTRGSALALAQAQWVADRLRRADPAEAVEIVRVTTLGDRGAALEDKSRWTSELERALIEDRIDVAVHSAKDVPTDLAEGFALVAVPARADPRDAICGAGGLPELAPGARVGTSSIRRAAQIRSQREDVEIVEVRGNVDTRLRKLAGGEVDALVLALAGLERLGRAREAGGVLDEFVPAPGQGALALEARAGAVSDERLAPVADREAMACVAAERALVAALGASCHTPVGAHARCENGQIRLVAWVGLPDGSQWLRDEVIGEPDAVGAVCAQRMISAGAAELLASSERELAG
jgi:hydroxymethylbilane synthase